MYEPYHKYTYDGPVLEFDTLVASHWKGETMAPSKQKARSNLAYQFKKTKQPKCRGESDTTWQNQNSNLRGDQKYDRV